MRDISSFVYPLTEIEFIEKFRSNISFGLKGNKHKFAELFSLEEFYASVQKGEAINPRGFRLAKFTKPNKTNLDTTTTSEVIRVKDIRKSLDEGNTICVTHIETSNIKLQEFIRELRKEFNLISQIQVNCYLSLDLSGADLHFDSGFGIILQIEGAKNWEYSSRPAVVWPVTNGQLDANGNLSWMGPFAESIHGNNIDIPAPNTLNKLTLEQGDMLCLPAGTWHSAKAVTYSLALNISIHPIDYSKILSFQISKDFLKKDSWRSGLSPFLASLPVESEEFKIMEQNWNERLSELKEWMGNLKMNQTSFFEIYKEVDK